MKSYIELGHCTTASLYDFITGCDEKLMLHYPNGCIALSSEIVGTQ